MSDQSLRDALIGTTSDVLGNWIEDGPVARRRLAGGIVDALLPLLAAHPAEPAAVVTDEAVEDLHAGVVTQFRRHGQYTLADARAALEAAAPLLGPRPAHPVEPDSRWPGYGVCAAEGRWGPCVFVAGHHEVEGWTPHADKFGRTWNDQPAEDPS